MKFLILVFSLLAFSGCSHKGHHHKHHGKHHMGHACKGKKSCEYKRKKKCNCKAAAVWFVSPKDGAKVASTFKLQFGVKGMSVHPAGQLKKDTGHHHLIVNSSSIEKGKVVPKDAKHIHFGKGQTETELTLPKGKHTLTLQFADGAHISYGENMSATVTVHVE